MTNKELKEILDKYPDNCIIAYRHNKHGRIDVDEVSHKEELTLSGKAIQVITLEASFEED